MTPSETKFVAQIKALLEKGKVAGPKYFEVGKLCGMKCKEVVDAKKKYFSAGTKASVKSAEAKNTTKTEQVPATELDELKTKYGSLVEDNEEPAGPPSDFGIIANTENEFVWIASPEEIANPSDLHSTSY